MNNFSFQDYFTKKDPIDSTQDCEDKLVARNSAMADEASILTVLDALQDSVGMALGSPWKYDVKGTASK